MPDFNLSVLKMDAGDTNSPDFLEKRKWKTFSEKSIELSIQFKRQRNPIVKIDEGGTAAIAGGNNYG